MAPLVFAGIKEERSMADDPFPKPEMPESLRDLMKMSIEQTKRAFDMFAATSEKAWGTLEASSKSAQTGMRAINERLAEITRSHADANFALALQLAESKDVTEAFELQSDHLRRQMETFVRQLEDLRDLTMQVIRDSNPVKPG